MTEKVNPWTLPEEPEPSWELYSERDGQHPEVWRIRIPGGYLYRLGKATTATFVPLATHRDF